MNKVKDEFFHLLIPELEKAGFKFKKSQTRFVRKGKATEDQFVLHCQAKYGRLNVTVFAQVYPDLLNASLQKKMGLDKLESFCFHKLTPREYYKVVEFKDAYHLSLYDGSLDIPEKDWLEKEAISLAQYLHPYECLQAAAENVLEIFRGFSMPFFEKHQENKYLRQALQADDIDAILNEIARPEHHGWKLLFWAKEEAPELVDALRKRLFDYSKTLSITTQQRFEEYLNLV